MKLPAFDTSESNGFTICGLLNYFVICCCLVNALFSLSLSHFFSFLFFVLTLNFGAFSDLRGGLYISQLNTSTLFTC